MKKRKFMTARILAVVMSVMTITTSLPLNMVYAAEPGDSTEIISSETEIQDSENMASEILDENEEKTETLTDASEETEDETIDVDDDSEKTEEQIEAEKNFKFVSNELLDLDRGEVSFIEFTEEELEEINQPYYFSEAVDKLASTDGTYDSRNYGYVPEIRNQGNHGTCWAHTTIALTEINAVKKGLADAATIDLSEQAVAYFTYNSKEDPLGLTKGDSYVGVFPSGSNYMDQGGAVSYAGSFLMNWQGPILEKDAPYQKQEVPEDLSSEKAYSMDAFHVQGMYKAALQDRDAVKKMVLDTGAAYVSYYSISSGYNNGKDFFYSSNTSGSNHAVTIVGWDDNYSKDNFKGLNGEVPAGDGAWIVRNSWGTWWGENGYFYLSYYEAASCTTCQVIGFDVESVDKYDNNYHYDGVPRYYSTSASYYQEVASVYEAQCNESEKEKVVAVAANFSDTNAQCKLHVYKLPAEADFSNISSMGELKSTIDVDVNYAGYYTFDIPENEQFTLSKGEKYAVTMEIGNQSSIHFNYPESYQGSYYKCTSASGHCYTRSSRGWSSTTYDFLLKGYTKNVKATDDPEVPKTEKLVLKLSGSDPAKNFYYNAKDYLSWNAITGAEKYLVSVYDKNGELVLLKEVTEGCTYDYELVKRELAPFTYSVNAVSKTGDIIATAVEKVTGTDKIDFDFNVSYSLVNETLSGSNWKIKFNFPGVSANKYELYRADSMGGVQKVADIEDKHTINQEFLFAGKAGSINYYFIRATKTDSWYVDSNQMKVSIPADNTTEGYGFDVLADGSVLVSWPEMDNPTGKPWSTAFSYDIYRNVEGSSDYTLIFSNQRALSFADYKNVPVGKKLKYKIVGLPQCDVRTTLCGEMYTPEFTKYAATELRNVKYETGKLTLAAKTESYANTYEFFVKEKSGDYSDDPTYISSSSSIVIATADWKIGETYCVKVRAANYENGIAKCISEYSKEVQYYYAGPSEIYVEEINRSLIKVKVEADALEVAIRKEGDVTPLDNLIWKHSDAGSVSFTSADGVKSNTQYEIYLRVRGASANTAIKKCDAGTKTAESSLTLVKAPTASLEVGQKLKNAVVTGAVFVDEDNNEVKGTFTWNDANKTFRYPAKAEGYYTFTPNDSGIAAYSGKADVNVSKAKPQVSVGKIEASMNGSEIGYTIPVYVKNISDTGMKFTSLTYDYKIYSNETGASTITGSGAATDSDTFSIKVDASKISADKKYLVAIQLTSIEYAQTTFSNNISFTKTGSLAFDKTDVKITKGQKTTLVVREEPVGIIKNAAIKAVDGNGNNLVVTTIGSNMTISDAQGKNIATFNSNTLDVYAIGESDVKAFTIKAELGSVTAEVKINVYVPVETIEYTVSGTDQAINSNKELSVDINDTKSFTIQTKALPANATLGNSIIIESSNEKIAYPENGKVTIKESGIAVITIKAVSENEKGSSNAEWKDSFTLYVKDRVAASMESKSLKIRCADSRELTVEDISVIDDLDLNAINEVTYSYVANGKYYFKATAENACGDDVTKNAKVKWSVSDTTVATITMSDRTGESGYGILTVKKSGDIKLTATTQDASKVTKSIMIHIVEPNVSLSSEKVAINLQDENRKTEAIDISSNYGMKILNVSVKDVTLSKETLNASDFVMEATEDGKYCLVSKNENLAKGTYKVNIEIITEPFLIKKEYDTDGREITKENNLYFNKTLTLTVKSATPNIKVGKPSINLFYLDQYTQDSTITCGDGTITKIEAKAEDNSGTNFDKYFTFSQNNKGEWTVTLVREPKVSGAVEEPVYPSLEEYDYDIDAWLAAFDRIYDEYVKKRDNYQTVDKYNASSMKGVVEITVDGFEPVKKEITIATPNKKISIKQNDTPSINSGYGNKKRYASLSFYDSTNKMTLDDVSVVCSTSDDSTERLKQVNLEDGSVGLELKDDVAYKASETITVPVTLTNPNWAEPVVVKAKVKVTSKAPKIVTKTSTIQLNIDQTFLEYDCAYGAEVATLPLDTDCENVVIDDVLNWNILEYDPYEKDYVEIDLYANDPYDFDFDDDFEWEDMDCIGTDNFWFTYNEERKQIETWIDGDNVPDTGNYKFRLYMLKDYEEVYKDIVIQVIDKPVSVSYKTAGAINLVDRDNSMVKITPTIKNTKATIVDMFVDYEYIEDDWDDDENEFWEEFYIDYDENQNAYFLKADWDAYIEKGIYELPITVELYDGVYLTEFVKIKTDIKLPKMSKLPKLEMKKNFIDDYIEIDFDDYIPDSYDIDYVEVLSVTKDAFDIYTYDSQMFIDMDDYSIKKGKYTVKVRLYFYGDDFGEKTVVQSIPITVSK